LTDPRYDRLGELVTGYSVDLREGQLVRIDGSLAGAPLLASVYRAALRRGARPYVNAQLEELSELLIGEASEEQLRYISPIERQEVELLDALVTVWSQANTRAFTHADPERQRLHLGRRRELRTRLWERISAGEASWCGTQAPTHAHAQDAEMSLGEYEDFVFGACHVAGEEDPVAHWRSLSGALGARARELSLVSELRIVGPGTDLKLGVEGRTWIAADGRQNMPDGEVYTSPVEEATEGEIRYSFPALFHGREVEDVRLRFEAGRVVAAEAARGQEYLRSLLDMDAEARYLGEVAFGLNYEIDRFTRNILFDEKIGGTMHLALGAGFPRAGGRNQSALHWDMICDLREQGEVHADGELIWKDGAFLTTPALEHVG
jgi:aminopeptidase